MSETAGPGSGNNFLFHQKEGNKHTEQTFIIYNIIYR